jgi:Flp pilus assembly protein TadD
MAFASRVWYTCGRPQFSTEHNRSAVASQPDFPEAHNNLGNLLARQGRVEEALAQSLEACCLKHEWAQAHYNLANALFLQKKLAEAETE